MKIKASPNEGKKHIELKKKAIEILEKRADVINIETEYKVRKENKWYSSVGVYGLKKDGSGIYIEVKDSETIATALTQLMQINTNNENDEFIIICKLDTIYSLRSIWRSKSKEYRDFLNKTQIYRYDKKLKLELVSISFKEDGELWLNKKKVLPKNLAINVR